LFRRNHMSNVGHRFSSAAVMLLIVSSAAPLMQGNRDNDNRDWARNDERAILWHTRSNGCAPGNDPPPGANCSQ